MPTSRPAARGPFSFSSWRRPIHPPGPPVSRYTEGMACAAPTPMATKKTAPPKRKAATTTPPRGSAVGPAAPSSSPSLESLAPPAPPRETIADHVRRVFPAIIAAWIEGATLDDIGNGLEPQLSGLQLRAVFMRDDSLHKVWLAAREERAHSLVDGAGSWAAVMGGKDGVEAKLKVAAILAPNEYGPKATRVEHTGAEGGPITTVQLDPAEAYKRMCRG